MRQLPGQNLKTRSSASPPSSSNSKGQINKLQSNVRFFLALRHNHHHPPPRQRRSRSVRSRRVSKEWLSLIDSPEFIQSQLQRSDQSLRRLFIETNSDLLYLSPAEGENEPSQKVLTQRLAGSKLLGACHGLVCTWFDLDRTFQILNPTTGERIYLPAASPHRFEVPGNTPFWYGFGYDRLSNDYKAVRILSAPVHRVEIYSVRAMSYRFIIFPFRVNYNPQNGVFARGKLHWVHVFDLLVLDLGSDTLRRLPLPDFGDSWAIHTRVGAVDYGDRSGRLCVSALYTELQRVDLWVMMTEKWSEDRWSKVYSVELGSIQRNHVSSLTIVGSGGGSRILFLLNHRQLFWYHPLTGHGVEAVEMNGIVQGQRGGDGEEIEVFCSMQSLVKILP